ncbi:MAG: hypothetical protein K0S74_1009 [Chlamydiales bacterium]|jgi:hypothetical protein|nr:hypothetical protein [Chlamydiales bacterium]
MQIYTHAKSISNTVANTACEVKYIALEMKKISNHAQEALQTYGRGSWVYGFLSSKPLKTIFKALEFVSRTTEKVSQCSYQYFKEKEDEEIYLRTLAELDAEQIPYRLNYISEDDVVIISIEAD